MAPAEAQKNGVPVPGGTLGSEPESEEHQRDRVIEEYLIYARKCPAPRRVHHIPFGPSIGVAALFLLIWNEPIHQALTDYLLPAFGG